jgi:hypothetical protein
MKLGMEGIRKRDNGICELQPVLECSLFLILQPATATDCGLGNF